MLLALASAQEELVYHERAGGPGAHRSRGPTPFGDKWRSGRAGAAGASRLMECGWYLRQGLPPVAARCPTDIWDEPPNEFWHWAAAEAAALGVWARHWDLVASEGAAEEALLRAAESGEGAG